VKKPAPQSAPPALHLLAALVAAACTLASCSINKLAVGAVADALTGSGGMDVFSSDSDPELVGDALPFAIKTYETLLAAKPKHQGLIVSTGSLFVMYANAFVQSPAALLPPARYEERDAAYQRAKALYLRGAAILDRGMEERFPAFATAYQDGKIDRLFARAKSADAALIYWYVAGIMGAYSLDPLDISLGVRLPLLEWLINRAYTLDPGFNDGALDEFMLLFYASLPEGMGGNKARAKAHFLSALQRTEGRAAGPYVSWAEAVCIPDQDYPSFKEYLEAALIIDPDALPALRLVNILSQRKAAYLLANAGRYFVEIEDGK
jgi:predicted anti-sigma-YlaC factor YlaD